jgi:hypothetical protein
MRLTKMTQDLLIGIMALIAAVSLFHSRFTDQTRREPALPTVLCRANGLSGDCPDIFRIGDCRSDYLGWTMKW